MVTQYLWLEAKNILHVVKLTYPKWWNWCFCPTRSINSTIFKKFGIELLVRDDADPATTSLFSWWIELTSNNLKMRLSIFTWNLKVRLVLLEIWPLWLTIWSFSLKFWSFSPKIWLEIWSGWIQIRSFFAWNWAISAFTFWLVIWPFQFQVEDLNWGEKRSQCGQRYLPKMEKLTLLSHEVHK